jgi:hypothetical protein
VTLLGVLTAFAVLGGLVLVAVLFMQRGRDGLDLSLGGLLRAYPYLGSPAGRPGAGDALSGGLAALPLWVAYLWLVLRALRTTQPSPPTVA